MKKSLTLLMFIVLTVGMAFVTGAGAATINAASCSQADVQTAITAAVDGDTVLIPAGTCAWTTYVSWSNKNISVIGAGIGNTEITSNGTLFKIITTTKGSFRVSGMTLSGASGQIFQILNNTATAYTKGWRIDNIRFNYTGNASQVNAFMPYGVTWGVIDHCIFDGAGYGIISIKGYRESDAGNGLGTYGHSLPLNLGTDEAIYFEDNTVNFSGANMMSFVFDLNYSGNVVVRYNTITGTYMQTHSARANDRGGRKFEVYNNTFIGDHFLAPSLLRSGTGVIFNNTVSGYSANNFVIDNQRTCLDFTGLFTRCNGSNPYDGNKAGEYGWPCVDQIGWTGVIGSQTNVPLYGWNNGSTATCATGGACNNSSVIALNGDFDLCNSSSPPNLSTHVKSTPHSNGEVDYVNNGSTPKPGYTPYTYPHPLTLAAAPAPAPEPPPAPAVVPPPAPAPEPVTPPPVRVKKPWWRRR